MFKFSLFYLFIIIGSLCFAQSNYIALITEPQIGTQEAADNLIKVVEDINIRNNISQVIVLGNITANGKFDEFIWAQEILDALKVPYFVVGGEKDYLVKEKVLKFHPFGEMIKKYFIIKILIWSVLILFYLNILQIIISVLKH